LASNFQLAGKNSARAEFGRLVLDLEHPRNPGNVLSPGQHDHGLHIRDRHQVRVVRALPHISRGKAGKPGAFAHHVIEGTGGNEFGFGDATHFDERAEEIFNAFLLYEFLEILGQLSASVAKSSF
jgi:hypothetical protein